VSAWGRDPIRAWVGDDRSRPIFIQRSAFVDSDASRLWHPRVLMPLIGAEGGKLTGTYAQVALLSYEPRFDLARKLWYVDLELQGDFAPDSFIRLGVVRFQPHAREDSEIAAKDGSRAIRCSPPETAWGQILPLRRLSVTWAPAQLPEFSGTQIAVTLSGPG